MTAPSPRVGRARGAAPWFLAALGGCLSGGEELVYVERSGCLSCHRPLRPDGTDRGIEDAHPPVGGLEVPCERCHGGDPGARTQSVAHVAPGAGGDPYIRDMTHRELDDVDPAYVRFVNPGDLRAAPLACGGDGQVCHGALVDRVARSLMATAAGELWPPRHRAGAQVRPGAGLAVYDAVDPSLDPGGAPNTVPELRGLTEPIVTEDERAVGAFQDLYLTKRCVRCHLWSFGRNRFDGERRSSGCTACHMLYADDGLSRSADPTVDRGAPPHPERHVLTTAIPTAQCVRCHHGGTRIGLSFQGLRERGAPGTDPPDAEVLGAALYGRDEGFLLADEDADPATDRTPPDVHLEAGMHCIDCHTEAEVHGDGRLHSSAWSEVEVTCRTCHGDADGPADLRTRKARPMPALERDGKGAVWLVGKVDGVRRRVPQVVAAIAAAPPRSAVRDAMGRFPSGFAHTDALACHACHNAWQPSCYGCHVSVDLSKSERSDLTGWLTIGQTAERPPVVRTGDLPLVRDPHGRIGPSMPAERLFLTARDGVGAVVLDRAARRGPGGRPGFGQRAIHAHTVRRAGALSRCDACHPRAGVAGEADRLAPTLGHGGGGLYEVDGQGVAWDLTAVVDPATGDAATATAPSLPLDAETVGRMMSVEVPAD